MFLTDVLLNLFIEPAATGLVILPGEAFDGYIAGNGAIFVQTSAAETPLRDVKLCNSVNSCEKKIGNPELFS